jgi:hypothetical protein
MAQVRHHLYAQIQALARAWNARRLVIDATGLGAGLADFLDRALPGRVLRYEFNTLTKSRLGWQFIEVVESGRFRLPRASEQHAEELLETLRAQFRACQYQVSQRQTQALRACRRRATHDGSRFTTTCCWRRRSRRALTGWSGQWWAAKAAASSRARIH